MLEGLYGAAKVKGILEQRREEDRRYIKSLTTENLLLPYYHEAGLIRITYMPKTFHGGWDSPLSMIRGTVCGHWLSASAHLYMETGEEEIKARADHVVREIGRCQKENGGEWCFPIPEKYLLWLKQGKRTWAPQYVCHKVMAGLLDMYRLAGNEQALQIVKRAADWFWRYTEDIDREQMARMMWEETGGMMEFFADLYSVTGEEKHLELMRRYERTDLFELLETGENPLVNMHANATVPEIMGAARAYEVTGEERYRRLTERYWELAVHRSGMFVTGGQTSGEAWTPEQRHRARLSDTNQEHCLVYHMMRLAEYLFRWTGKAEYADYWERNLYNGIFAQGFWKDDRFEQFGGSTLEPQFGYVAYHLPLQAGARKVWGSATGDFWCCHNTLMQANVSLYRALYYRDEDRIVVAQYQDSEVSFLCKGKRVRLELRRDSCTGEIIRIERVNREITERPGFDRVRIRISCEEETAFTLALRLPWWLAAPAMIEVNGERQTYEAGNDGFAELRGSWREDEITVTLPKEIRAWPLPDDTDMVAFLDGPVALAGLTEEERTLYYTDKPEELLVPCDERRWAQWLPDWKTVGQPVNIRFRPLYRIGYEAYTTYFPVQRREPAEDLSARKREGKGIGYTEKGEAYENGAK